MLQHLIKKDEGLRMVPIDRNQLATAVNGLHEELRALPTGTDPDRARVLTRWIGIGHMTLGDYPGARTFLRQALDLAAASGNGRAVVAIELNLGDVYRYGGEVETAGGYYRSALASARAQHPDLVDFALQHTAKHLMEKGDLASSHAHLLEALELRIAKGDAELITSTRAAVARVEVMLGPAGAGTVTATGGHAEPASGARDKHRGSRPAPRSGRPNGGPRTFPPSEAP
ncbi:tetratricopeptide repeat protein [Streptomyces sp. NPDC048717]|uniref:tetratricopeptide repeat protein n=1 Tax=Streptomyces sp. NPDC048717 TaxID=3154928 RepID=UPI00341ADCA2